MPVSKEGDLIQRVASYSIAMIDESIAFSNSMQGIEFDPGEAWRTLKERLAQAGDGREAVTGVDPMLTNFRQESDQLVNPTSERGIDSLADSRQSWKTVDGWTLDDRSRLTLFRTPKGMCVERVYPDGRRLVRSIPLDPPQRNSAK